MTGWIASAPSGPPDSEVRYRGPEEACYLGNIDSIIEHDRPSRPPTAEYRVLAASVQAYGDGDYRCLGVVHVRVNHGATGWTLIPFATDALIVGSAEACNVPNYTDPVNGQCGPPKCTDDCCGDCGNGTNPIHTASGNKYQRETDFVGMGPFPLRMVRTYNSNRAPEMTFSFGAGWTHSYAARLIGVGPEPFARAIAYRPDGRILTFQKVGPVWRGDPDVSQRLNLETDATGMPQWTLTENDDTVERYDGMGLLQSLTNRDGFSQTLIYVDPNGRNSSRVQKVVDSQGRVLTFGYNSTLQLTSVTDEAGRVFAYGYTGINLTSVTYPVPTGTRTRSYLYNEAGQTSGASLPGALTGIVDEAGQRFASWGYTAAGRANLSVHGPFSSGTIDRTSLTFNADGTTTIIDGLGKSRVFGFDVQHLVARIATLDQPCDDCAGAAKAKTYDTNGHPASARDFRDTETLYSYDVRGLEAQRIEANTIPNPANPSTRITPEERRTVNTVWNANFRVPDRRTIVNRFGTTEARTDWAYNPRGQVTARCEIDPADSAAMSYTCSATTAPPANAKVRRSVTTYCEQADVTAGTCPLVGLVTSVNGPRATSEAGMGGFDDTTTYTYYQTDDPSCASGGACPHRHGDLWKVTNALGKITETVSYDKNGRVTRSKDANGTLTDFAYHPRGWLTDRIVRANGNGSASANDATLHIDYDPVGNVVKVTQPDGDYLAYTYDDAHRLIKIADNLANSIDYCPGGVGSAECLDAAGNRRVEQVKDANGTIKRQLHRVYNQLGQLTQQLNAANVPIESSMGLSENLPGQPAVADGYDSNGNRVLSDDGLGTRTKQQYDGLNRLVATIQNYNGIDTATANTTTHYAYDTRDNLRQVTDPDDLNTVYDYDGLNNLTGLNSPDTGNASYTYDKAGNRITQTDARNVTSTYTYDALNRLTAIAYPTSSLNVSYAYDQPNTTTGCAESYPVGRLTKMTDPTGSTTYCYDRHGNVTKKTQVGTRIVSCLNGTSGCGGVSSFAAGLSVDVDGIPNPTKSTTITLVTAMAYTKGDRIQSITYPSGAIISYGRDTLGRISSVQYKANANATAVNLIGSATYYPFGPLDTLTWGNGRTLTKSYDADYAIDSIQANPTGLTLDATTDVMGNVTALSQTLSPATPDRSYQYDPLYRLSKANAGATTRESYGYSPTGDRTSATLDGATQAYTYTAGTHHLASVGATARSYDDNGNTTSNNLAYDQRNRLAGWKLQGGQISLDGDSAQYGYNGKGERTVKQVTYNNHCLAPACYPVPEAPIGWLTGTATFAYDEAGHLIGEYPSLYGPGRNTEYIYLDGTPIAAIRSGQIHEIETDHLGTPRAIVRPGTTPSADVTVWRWDLLGNTFGGDAPNEDADGDGTAFSFNLRYPGQYADVETGLNYNYFRDYEPGTGRYIESDPIGLNGGPSSYSYVSAAPLRRVDRRGLLQIDPSCNYCDKEGDVAERVMRNASIACVEKIKLIKNATLSDCILKRCLSNAKVICNGTSCTPGIGGYNDWSGVASGAFIVPGVYIPSPNVHICVPNTSWKRGATNLLHELAHSCAWDHGNGDGVPHDPNPQPWPRQ